MSQVVLLAAGRGARLGPLTAKRSKALMPVLGVPVVGRVLEAFIEVGFKSFVVVIWQGDQELLEYLKDFHPGKATVQIVFQEETRGMGEALGCAARWLDDRFLVAACDSLYSKETLDRFTEEWNRRPELEALLGVDYAGTRNLQHRSVVILDGRVVRRIIEKPSLQEISTNVTSLPLYGFGQKILAEIPRLQVSPRGEYELQPAIQRLIDASEKVEGIFIKRRWNLTHAEDLLAMNLDALKMEGRAEVFGKGVEKTGVTVHPPVHVESGVVLGRKAVIGPEVYLESGCAIGEGVNISHSVVLRHARVPSFSRIKGEVVV